MFGFLTNQQLATAIRKLEAEVRGMERGAASATLIAAYRKALSEASAVQASRLPAARGSGA